MANWSRRNLSSPDPQKYMAEFWSAGVHSSKLQKHLKLSYRNMFKGEYLYLFHGPSGSYNWSQQQQLTFQPLCNKGLLNFEVLLPVKLVSLPLAPM